jgi:hypothetical protein
LSGSQSCIFGLRWSKSCEQHAKNSNAEVFRLRAQVLCHAINLRGATVGGCDFFNFLWPESCEEHLLISIAGVLRLRAVSPVLSDRSARRFAQDDDSVVGIENIGSSAKNTKRSKKSQALRMTIQWEVDENTTVRRSAQGLLKEGASSAGIPLNPKDGLNGAPSVCWWAKFKIKSETLPRLRNYVPGLGCSGAASTS